MADRKTVTVFLTDSVPTAHLRRMNMEASDKESADKMVRDVEQRSAPTGHLPRAPREGGTGASVPTGHLPTDASPSPKPSDDKK
jgi:hypothetical protein